MNRPTARDAWVVILGAAIYAEARALRAHDDGTLSAFTRATFRTHTPTGRAAFTGFIVVGGTVFWRHIVKPIVKELS
jgi:hypothetical protein